MSARPVDIPADVFGAMCDLPEDDWATWQDGHFAGRRAGHRAFGFGSLVISLAALAVAALALVAR